MEIPGLRYRFAREDNLITTYEFDPVMPDLIRHLLNVVQFSILR